jgi:2TM domain
MPPRWSSPPDRKDPAYRRLDDRMNFATHVAIFSAINSCIWFVRTLKAADWTWAIWFTGIWALALVANGVFIFAIANYSNSAPDHSASDQQG